MLDLVTISKAVIPFSDVMNLSNFLSFWMLKLIYLEILQKKGYEYISQNVMQEKILRFFLIERPLHRL